MLALTPLGYSVNANPKVFGGTGRRTFYIDQDGTGHQNWSQGGGQGPLIRLCSPAALSTPTEHLTFPTFAA